MSKTLEIKLPSSLDKYSINQANDVIDLLSAKEKDSNWSTEGILELIGTISGIPVSELKRVDIGAIKESFLHIQKTLSREKKDPPLKITIKGTVYVFDKKMGKDWAASRFIDAENSGTDLKNFPEKFVSICYIPEGTEYDDTTVEERSEIFREHFPGSIYIDLTDFFFRKLEQLSPGFLVLQSARREIQIKKAMELLRTMRKTG